MGEGGSDVGEGKSELLLGVDIGTSGTSGVIARPDGEVVATAEKDHAVRLPRPGWVEHDAEEDWWDGFVAVCSELLDQADGKVAALSISGIGPCLLAAGGDGRPLRPGILYGVDTRATKEVEELTDRYGNEEIMEVGGNPLTAQSVGPKILWLRRNEPEVWQETRYLLMAHTFIVHRLTGEYVLDHPSASMCDPIYDVGKYQWVESWAEDVAPGLELPALRWPSEVAGVVTKEAAEKTGLPAGILVTTGTTDAFSEAVSVGVREPGDLMLMYGTTMATLEISEKALVTRSLWSTAGLFEETYALFAAMSTSGALTDWVRQICGGKSFEELTEKARKVASGSEGLLVLPYFAGERTPVSDPKARGVICGLTLSHGQGHLYRAMLEATAFGVRHLFEAMGEAGGRKKRLVAVGGGTKGGLWTQIVSNTIGEPQELPEQNIGASYGDALLAGIAADLVETDADWSRIVETVEPDPSQQEVYDELYTIYRDLYPATRDQAHTLTDIQTRQSEA
jgi:xylulokinase